MEILDVDLNTVNLDIKWLLLTMEIFVVDITTTNDIMLYLNVILNIQSGL